jgi:hypothetical protein
VLRVRRRAAFQDKREAAEAGQNVNRVVDCRVLI